MVSAPVRQLGAIELNRRVGRALCVERALAVCTGAWVEGAQGIAAEEWARRSYAHGWRSDELESLLFPFIEAEGERMTQPEQLVVADPSVSALINSVVSAEPSGRSAAWRRALSHGLEPEYRRLLDATGMPSAPAAHRTLSRILNDLSAAVQPH